MHSLLSVAGQVLEDRTTGRVGKSLEYIVRHRWHQNFLSVMGRQRSTIKLPIKVSDLYEISAGIVKDGDGGSGRFGWFLGEGDAVLLQICVFLLDVGDEEIGGGNSLLMDLLLEGFRSRIGV
jgi:hypothetical protein